MEFRIEWTYKTPKGTETVFHSEEMPAAKALLMAEDVERTGRVKKLVFIDRHDSNWSLKELKKYIKGIETEPHNITVYFDGGFNPGTSAAGLGCVIYYEQNGKSYRLRHNAASAELFSNNEAEYAALHLSLQELDLLNVHDIPIKFIGDSKVVINQMDGDWPVIEVNLAKWADRIDDKMKDLGIDAAYELVPRKNNAEADQLATQALNGIDITGTTEISKE